MDELKWLLMGKIGTVYVSIITALNINKKVVTSFEEMFSYLLKTIVCTVIAFK